MSTPLTQRLYLRIWSAVVGAVVLLTITFGWILRQDAERERAQRPGREIILRDAHGEVLGLAQARGTRVPGQGLEFEVPLRDGQTIYVQLPRPGNRPPGPPAPGWFRPPYNLLVLLALIAGAVALGAYPVVRRLTKRLEALQQGVERWGEGDLSRRLPEDGQDEVAFLAQRFNIAAARVQALLLSHKALLANASHELRSPLARIRMGLELMQAQPSPAAREEMARNIRELDQLIDEILLASRLDASPDDLGPLEPVDLVGLCAEECARTGAELETPPGVTSVVVSGLTRLVRRALRNLLENARRHGAGRVTLTLRITAGQADLQVCDQGPGVPADLRERIFEPFFRLPGASEREGNVGLGLALVRSIAVRHGGSIECRANPEGQGACFVLRLPLAKAA
ncbi:MAG: ATP-binding protein [Curvibacter sp.]|jgi:two-component system OmpR family sensor kinase|nr:HAMP domain-containing protein [Curvibacter sp.]